MYNETIKLNAALMAMSKGIAMLEKQATIAINQMAKSEKIV